MRIAGVRLDDARRVWADAGDSAVQPGDRVALVLDGQECEGEVFVAPEQLLGRVEAPTGVIVRESRGGDLRAKCGQLAGADMPPLGSLVHRSTVEGMVVGIDAINRTVTVRGDDGTDSTIAWPETEGSEVATSGPPRQDEAVPRSTESVGSAPAPRA